MSVLSDLAKLQVFLTKCNLVAIMYILYFCRPSLCLFNQPVDDEDTLSVTSVRGFISLSLSAHVDFNSCLAAATFTTETSDGVTNSLPGQWWNIPSCHQQPTSSYHNEPVEDLFYYISFLFWIPAEAGERFPSSSGPRTPNFCLPIFLRMRTLDEVHHRDFWSVIISSVLSFVSVLATWSCIKALKFMKIKTKLL